MVNFMTQEDDGGFRGGGPDPKAVMESRSEKLQEGSRTTARSICKPFGDVPVFFRPLRPSGRGNFPWIKTMKRA